MCTCCRIRPSRYSQILARKRRALGFVDLLFRSRKQPPRVFKLRQRERVSRYKLKRPRPRRNKDREHQLLSSSIYTHTQTKLYMQTLKKNKNKKEKRARHKTQSLCQQRAPFFSQKVHTPHTQHNRRFEISLSLAGFFVDIFHVCFRTFFPHFSRGLIQFINNYLLPRAR